MKKPHFTHIMICYDCIVFVLIGKNNNVTICEDIVYFRVMVNHSHPHLLLLFPSPGGKQTFKLVGEVRKIYDKQLENDYAAESN